MAKVSDEMIKSKLVAGNTRFGFKLLSEVLKKDAGKNVFISPTSVAIALAMTYNGASGDTQRAMAQALELNGLSLEEMNAAYAALKTSLENADPQVQLSIANSLWARQGVRFKSDFLQRNELFFRAQVSELDFNDPKAVEAINAWVNQNTNGKIQKIVEAIPREMMLYLINAIYFKGTWTKEFDKAKTQDLPFHLPDGSQQQTPLMAQSGFFQYLETPDFQAVSLPYGDENGERRISMVVFLPAQGSDLAALQAKLNDANWAQWMGQFQRAEGDLKLPRFKLEYETSLNVALQALGMGVAFTPGAADFSAMLAGEGDQQLFITEVKHKTYVDVNEEGTEAAAVTSVGVGTTSMREPSERFTMTVDRPFFFAIRDDATGAVLFMGSIVKP